MRCILSLNTHKTHYKLISKIELIYTEKKRKETRKKNTSIKIAQGVQGIKF